MKIGIPSEIKSAEARVALVPAACAALAKAGHQVLVQAGAGVKAGFTDEDYRQAGAWVVATAAELYGAAELIVKVKEPLAGDLALLKPHHTLFCYLHLAGVPGLGEKLCGIGLTAYAFETVVVDGRTPLLAPMSAIAGRLATQLGCRFLQRPMGGKGVLLGGITGHQAGVVTVVGAGVAGTEAAVLASQAGATVHLLDVREEALSPLHEKYPAIKPHLSTPDTLKELLPQTDLLVGAVYKIGQKAPQVVSADQMSTLAPGSVAVDIAIDQGGCFETSKPCTHDAPTYLAAGVLHSCITNLPAAVPQTASAALSAKILPYVQELASGTLSKPLAAAVNVAAGSLKISY